MFGALTSLTGGGGLSASASSSTGAIGGDTFTQDFGGIQLNDTPWFMWAFLLLVVAAMVFFAYRVMK